MKIGNKIQKYRILRNKTQKELGKEIGFPESSADSRIRKFENNIVNPKPEIKEKIADKLDIDISALSDINIQNLDDVMQILFEFEDLFGLDLSFQDTKPVFNLDENSACSKTLKKELLSRLYVWNSQKNTVLSKDSTNYEEDHNNYLLWKAQFPIIIKENESKQLKKIDDFYQSKIKNLLRIQKEDLTAFNIIEDLQQIIHSKIYPEVSISDELLSKNTGGLILCFMLKDFFEIDEEAQNNIAKLLCDFKKLESYNISIRRHIYILPAGMQVEFTISQKELMTINRIILKLISIEKKEEDNDYKKQNIENLMYELYPYKHVNLKEEL